MADLEIGGLESSQNTGNEWSEVSKEDLVRVNEQLGESRKYRGMIGSSVTTNTNIAAFLKFLIVEINANEFWDTIECFYVRAGIGELMFLSTTFCACMLPLYPEKADELWMDKAFSVDYHIPISFYDYLPYIQKVFAHDKESWKVDEKKFIVFLRKIVDLWNIVPEDKLALSQIKIDALSQPWSP